MVYMLMRTVGVHAGRQRWNDRCSGGGNAAALQIAQAVVERRRLSGPVQKILI